MIRYRAKKWWSLKESPDGQYVAYHEHEEAMAKLQGDNAKLWERLAQQAEEYEELKADRKACVERHVRLYERHVRLYERYNELETTLKDMSSNVWGLVTAISLSILAAVGIFFKLC